jgi:sugar/nucleoside kinase (ribokinase family)
MLDLITIGDALIDTHVFIDNATLECDINQQNCQLCLNYASKIPITHSFQTLGGNAANVAISARNLGLSTAIIASIGKDANGQMVKAELKKQKVHTKLLHTDDAIPTRYAVVLNFKQERTILSYHQKRTYKLPKRVPTARWIYYTSLSEGYEQMQHEFVDFLSKHKNTRLAYNPGSLQLQNLDMVKEIIARTDILIVNVEEALTILNKKTSPNLRPETLISELLVLGAKEAVITDSHNGAWSGDGKKTWHCPGFPITVVSKTGAGDAFSAGYLAARLHDQPAETALIWGIGCSSHIISTPHTAQSRINKKEMTSIISKFSSIKPSLIS